MNTRVSNLITVCTMFTQHDSNSDHFFPPPLSKLAKITRVTYLKFLNRFKIFYHHMLEHCVIYSQID